MSEVSGSSINICGMNKYIGKVDIVDDVGASIKVIDKYLL